MTFVTLLYQLRYSGHINSFVIMEEFVIQEVAYNASVHYTCLPSSSLSGIEMRPLNLSKGKKNDIRAS